MKGLVLVLLLAAAGYYWWSRSVAEEEAAAAAEAAPVVAEAPVPPVEFGIKMRVKRILDEWKKQSLATGAKDKRTSMVEIEGEINVIRRRLYEQGLHDAVSLKDTMVQAAVELGYAPDQARHLVIQVLGGR